MDLKAVETYRSLVEEVQSSFIYGAVTTFIKEKIKNKNNTIVLKIRALRKAADFAEYTLIFNTLMYMMRLLRIKAKISPLLCVFLSSFYSVRKNGFIFAFKSAGFGLLMNIVSSMF